MQNNNQPTRLETEKKLVKPSDDLSDDVAITSEKIAIVR